MEHKHGVLKMRDGKVVCNFVRGGVKVIAVQRRAWPIQTIPAITMLPGIQSGLYVEYQTRCDPGPSTIGSIAGIQGLLAKIEDRNQKQNLKLKRKDPCNLPFL